MAKKAEMGDAFELPPARKRTEVPERTATAFTEPSRSKAAKGSSRLRREGPGERVNAYLPPDVVAVMRETAFRERRSLSDVLTEAATEWYRKRQRARVQEG